MFLARIVGSKIIDPFKVDKGSSKINAHSHSKADY